MSFDRMAAAVMCAAAFLIMSCDARLAPDGAGEAEAGRGGGGGRGGSTGGAGAAGTWGALSGASAGASGVAGHAMAGASGSWEEGAAAGAGGVTTVGPPAAAGATGAAAGGAAAGPVTGAAGAATGVGGAAGTAIATTTGAAGRAVTGAAGTATGVAGRPSTGAAGSGATATPTSSPGATIVPLYTNPDHASWAALVTAKQAHPKVGIIAVVNPSSGPGSDLRVDYTAGIAKLIAANIRVIGYVGTNYTAKTPAAVKADIDLWKTFYPNVQGIFFDEQSNKAEHVAYYRDLAQYAKTHGLPYTVGNPGADTAEAFVGALDMMLIYESDGVPALSKLQGWHANHAPSNFGVIPYATAMDPTFVREARKYVGYIYLQSDDLPNPWDSLPTYFNDLLTALE
jgi:hypothetical protein